MEVTKVNKVSFKDSNGVELIPSDKVVWNNKDGECKIGIYRGLNNRNALIIDSFLEANTSFAVQPRSIKSLYVVKAEVVE